MLPLAALDGQASDWLTTFGPIVFYLIVWGLVFSGTGLFVGVFIPFDHRRLSAVRCGAYRRPSRQRGHLAAGQRGRRRGVSWDQVGFILGRHYGRPYLDRRKGGWIASAVAKSEKFYDDLGWWAVVVARFIPWGRVFVPPIAGIARMNYYRFLVANLVGALAWGC